MGRMSKNKGKGGEREVAAIFTEAGIPSSRGVQFQGGVDSPDVKISLKGYHLEVKRTETFRMWPALDQAMGDAQENVPVVVHRPNRKPWVAVLLLDDFIKLLKKAEGLTPATEV